MMRMSSIVKKFSTGKEFVIKEVGLRIISLRLFYCFYTEESLVITFVVTSVFLTKKKTHSVLIKAIMQEVEGLRD